MNQMQFQYRTCLRFNICAFCLFLITIILASCTATGEIHSTGGSSAGSSRDGLSFETAIKVTGIGAEYVWLKTHYPGYRHKMQSLCKHDNMRYDVHEIVTTTGEKISIYFELP